MGGSQSVAGAQGIAKPQWGLLADPEGLLVSPLHFGVDRHEAEQSGNFHRQGLFQRQLEEGASFSGRLQPGCWAGEGSEGWTSVPMGSFPSSLTLCTCYLQQPQTQSEGVAPPPVE